MKHKWPWITSLVICLISLVVGASFHGLRMHPENVVEYGLGCTMGIIMAVIAGLAFVAFIFLLVIYRRSIHSENFKLSKH